MSLLAILALALTPWAAAQTPQKQAPQKQAPEQADDAPCRVHGRLVDTQGAPVAGATVKIHGWGANSDRIQRYGTPEDWKDPETVSDTDGRYAFSFVSPRAFQYTLQVEHADYGKIRWRWHKIDPAQDLDVGTGVLEAPAVITGYVVGSDGELLVEGWFVGAWHHPAEGSGDRESIVSYAAIDPEEGTFRIADLPPGRVELSARDRNGVETAEKRIETKAGEIAEVELEVDGPDPRKRILLNVFPRPYSVFPAERTVHAVAEGGRRYPLVPVPGRTNDWHVIELIPGTYTVEIDDPRFEPWRQEGVSTGTQVTAHLKGSAALRLHVVTPGGGAATHYGVRIRYRREGSSPRTVVLAEDGAAAPVDGRIDGVVPGDFELEVRVPDWPAQYVVVGALAAGETRELTVSVTGGLPLSGTVLRADGSPAPGVAVQLTRGDVPGHDLAPGTRISTWMEVQGKQRAVRILYRDQETRTGADGTFAFPRCTASEYAVRVVASPYAFVDRVVALEADASPVTIPLAPLGDAELTVLLPADAARDDIAVRLRRVDHVDRGHERPAPIGPDGACLLEGLPTGSRTFLAAITFHENSTDFTMRQIELGSLVIRAGERARATYDLRESFPVAGTVSVTIAGEPLPSRSQAVLQPEKGTPRRFRQNWAPQSKGRYKYLVEAGAYRVIVSAYDAGWIWTSPAFRLERGGESDQVIDVPLVQRTLRVLDPEGQPLAGREITWWSHRLRPGSAKAQTDREGRLTLELPPGKHNFASANETQGTELAWTTGDGDLELVLQGD
ncbi:MAG: carboxypeptidase regulatory-like domain-containing protein [bacterium]|nr:carboxypeptidase regulatory-like domain-containing protein [bacterium]